MTAQEIYPAGSFKQWDEEVLFRFRESEPTTNVGEQLLFENELVKVWSIKLAPGNSLPFHKHTKNYNWTAITNGSAISYYETGRIVKIDYDKGDLSYYDHDKKGDFIHNLKNTGSDILEFVTVEYKNE